MTFEGEFTSVRDSMSSSVSNFDWKNNGISAAVLMGDPYWGTAKGLDPRKGFLADGDQPFLNVLGMEEHSLGDERDTFEVTEEGKVKIAGHEAEDLNDEYGGRTLTVFPTNSAVEKLGAKGTAAIAASDQINTINPRPLYSIANSKVDQHWLFDQSDVPIPFFTEVRPTGNEEMPNFDEEVDRFLNDFSQASYDGPVIVKKSNGGRGEDIEFFDSPQDVVSTWNNYGEIPSHAIAQVDLNEPEYDERVILGGDMTFITAEERYGPEDSELNNLSQIGGEEEMFFGDKIDLMLEEGLVKGKDIDDLEETKKDVIGEIYTTVMDYVESEWGLSDNYREHFRGSIDLLVWDPKNQDHLPDTMIDNLSEYQTDDGNVITPIEWNNQSGSMIDAVNMPKPDQDSAVNLAKQMYSMSEGDSYDERGLPYNMTFDDYIPNQGEGLGVQREGNRFFGLFRKAQRTVKNMTIEDLYHKAVQNSDF